MTCCLDTYFVGDILWCLFERSIIEKNQTCAYCGKMVSKDERRWAASRDTNPDPRGNAVVVHYKCPVDSSRLQYNSYGNRLPKGAWKRRC